MNDTSPALPKRVIMADVARVASVHKSTVSLALRNDPSIPAHTRTRIQAIARQLDYRPDPVLDAFNRHRLGRTTRSGYPLAFVSNLGSREEFERSHRHKATFAAARAAAEAHGCSLECFLVGPRQLSIQRLAQILRARGIAALILGLPDSAQAPVDLDWSRFCAIAIESPHPQPPLDTLSGNYREASKLAIERLATSGCRRPGISLDSRFGTPILHQLRAGYLFECHHLRLPCIDSHDCSAKGESLDAWAIRQSVDGIVFAGSTPRPCLVGKKRMPLPRAAIAVVEIDGTYPALPGVAAPHALLGQHAVERLMLHLHANLSGLPTLPATTLMPIVWRD